MKVFPEPKSIEYKNKWTNCFNKLRFAVDGEFAYTADEFNLLLTSRFWNYPELLEHDDDAGSYIDVQISLVEGIESIVLKQETLKRQAYELLVTETGVEIKTSAHEGVVNALTTLKMLLQVENAGFRLQCCDIVDYPSIPVRAIAPTFSWYAGYGRIGFDMQLWGFSEWARFVDQCVDQKINQMNMVMYGFWPFEFEGYEETEFRDLDIKIWNEENQRFIKIKYSHPNIAEPFLAQLLEYAHSLGVSVFAYVGLNSYNGGWTIAHPEKRMIPPEGTEFLNDFDSVCLSDEENRKYILASMRKIAELGFDGFSLEESEEGFWFCNCDRCAENWGSQTESPGEAKHFANLELLREIHNVVRQVNPECVIGIRAFRQPPLEKDIAWLESTAASIPDDVVLFWAPALYVPSTEFEKWIHAFGAERIWGRDSESNSITSTMGRLFRTFETNVLRYEDEANIQVIERDIEQHISSVQAGVHGVNGFMFEWYGLFYHLFAHGNYGWGSTIPQDEFFTEISRATFGDVLGDDILKLLKGILTIHESQLSIYKTPFPFQSNVIRQSDRAEIEEALERQPSELNLVQSIRQRIYDDAHLRSWEVHFRKIENSIRRNREIYQMALACLDYEAAEEPNAKRKLLVRIQEFNECDFAIAKQMFFDLNPVDWTGVKSCMMPYHELSRQITNLKNPESPDSSVICSGIEALGWLWLAKQEER